MWMILQYLKDIKEDMMPWIYAVIIVITTLLILATAI